MTTLASSSTRATLARTATAPNKTRTPRGRTGRVLAFVAWTVLALASLHFVNKYALHYLVPGGRLGAHAAHPFWIRLHVSGGMIALFVGLTQLVTGRAAARGAARRRVHRWTGRVYVGAIVVSCAAAIVILLGSPANWVFRWGLWGLIAAWIATTGLAYVAIRRGNVTQHREWMARSYATTFGFVTFRALFDLFGALRVGTIDERVGFAAWACWAVPLLAVEVVISGRKALVRKGERGAVSGWPRALDGSGG